MTPTSSSTSSSRTPAKANTAMHEHPIGAFLLGLLFLFFALWDISVQLTTSEGWFLGTSAALSLAPHFSILAQPVAFVQGALPGLQMEAFTYAWGVEVLQFLFSTGLVFTTLGHNRVASWICIIGCVCVMVLDSMADYLFNGAANNWQQAGFAFVLFLMAFGLTYYALHLLIAKGLLGAWKRWGPH